MCMVDILVMWSKYFVYIFIPILPKAVIWTSVLNDRTVSEREKKFNFEIWVIFGHDQNDLWYSFNFIDSFRWRTDDNGSCLNY